MIQPKVDLPEKEGLSRHLLQEVIDTLERVCVGGKFSAETVCLGPGRRDRSSAHREVKR